MIKLGRESRAGKLYTGAMAARKMACSGIPSPPDGALPLLRT